MRRLVIIGAGGHGKVVADCAEQTGKYDSIGFLDARDEISMAHNWSLLGKPDDFQQYSDSKTDFFVAIGDNATRQKWQQELIEKQAPIATLVHPDASVSPSVQIGVGTLVLAKVAINIDAVIGEGCIVNTGATIDHDCVLEEFVHVAPGCHLAGDVHLDARVFAGVGVALVPGIHVGVNAVIGAGATVIQNVDEAVTVVGTPAKPINSNKGAEYA
jgi:sugar O-acyltransferase (sialic acid O-acetyltransferase NeuD family)